MSPDPYLCVTPSLGMAIPDSAESPISHELLQPRLAGDWVGLIARLLNEENLKLTIHDSQTSHATVYT